MRTAIPIDPSQRDGAPADGLAARSRAAPRWVFTYALMLGASLGLVLSSPILMAFMLANGETRAIGATLSILIFGSLIPDVWTRVSLELAFWVAQLLIAALLLTIAARQLATGRRSMSVGASLVFLAIMILTFQRGAPTFLLPLVDVLGLARFGATSLAAEIFIAVAAAVLLTITARKIIAGTGTARSHATRLLVAAGALTFTWLPAVFFDETIHDVGFADAGRLLLGWCLLILVPTVLGLVWAAVYLPARWRRLQRFEHAQAVSPFIVPSAERYAIPLARYLAMARRKAELLGLYLVIVLSLVPVAIALVVTVGFGTAAIAAWLLWCIVIGIGFAFRKRALRILLLRPFGEKKMTSALRQFVCATIGRAGHVYTLSDKNYRPSLLMNILVQLPLPAIDIVVAYILGPLIKNSQRLATVRDARTFRKLELALMRQVRPSSRSFLCGGQAFNIASADAWWQRCIQMLMHSCDFIVIDLSRVKEGTAWELEELHQRSLLNKCIFLVVEESRAELDGIIAQHFDRASPPMVFTYRADGQIPAAERAHWDAMLTQRIETGLAALAQAA